MNHKAIEFLQSNSAIIDDIKTHLEVKLDQLLDGDRIFFHDIHSEFRTEFIFQIAREISNQTGESYLDCLEVAEFYVDNRNSQ